jgi:ketosteroid isomerase-like protein
MCGIRMRRWRKSLPLLAAIWLNSPSVAHAESNAALVEQVRAAETAFAKSMAERNLAAFGSFVSSDAIFIGSKSVLRGRAAVVAGWKPFFDGASAPFSWAPEQVEVLADGKLAFSAGPVFDPNGKRTGIFKSTWRRDRDGHWRVAIDSGCQACACAAAD